MTEIIIGSLLGIFLFSVIVNIVPKIFESELHHFSNNLNYHSPKSSAVK